jgi:hypothetical protein
MFGKNIKVERKKGYIHSVEKKDMKRGKTLDLVQTRNYTGWVGRNPKTGRLNPSVKGRTESAVLNSAVKSRTVKKVIFR